MYDEEHSLVYTVDVSMGAVWKTFSSPWRRSSPTGLANSWRSVTLGKYGEEVTMLIQGNIVGFYGCWMDSYLSKDVLVL